MQLWELAQLSLPVGLLSLCLVLGLEAAGQVVGKGRGIWSPSEYTGICVPPTVSSLDEANALHRRIKHTPGQESDKLKEGPGERNLLQVKLLGHTDQASQQSKEVTMCGRRTGSCPNLPSIKSKMAAPLLHASPQNLPENISRCPP